MTPHLEHAAPIGAWLALGNEAINIALLTELRAKEKSKQVMDDGALLKARGF
jgi:hypothetical protein